MYCPECNTKMLCPCESCRAQNKDRPGEFWVYINGDNSLACGKCGFCPRNESRTFHPMIENLGEYLSGGWDAIAFDQLEQDKREWIADAANNFEEWPDLISDDPGAYKKASAEDIDHVRNNFFIVINPKRPELSHIKDVELICKRELIFGVHQSQTAVRGNQYKWVVTDAVTGLCCGMGMTKEDATADFNKLWRRKGRTRFVEQQERQISYWAGIKFAYPARKRMELKRASHHLACFATTNEADF